MATKIALLAQRRSTLVFALTVIAAIAGAFHGVGFGCGRHSGMWDGPL